MPADPHPTPHARASIALRRLALAALACASSGCDTGLTRPGGTGSPPGGGNRNLFSYQAVFAGSTHSCALVNGGSALCWGTGGDLGDGTFESADAPVRVEGAQTFATLDVGSFSCGITTNGDPWCWGVNAEGRLGNGNAEYEPFPTSVETDERFLEIGTGARHTCALATDRAMWCWGSNRFGQLIDHPDTLSFLPIEIAPGRAFETMDAGGLRTCALDSAGLTLCWGDGLAGGLVEIAGAPEFTAITVGSAHACGLTTEGRAYCFGSNTEGQLGDGTFTSTPAEGPPVPVDTDERFVSLSAGEFHTCAITAEGVAWCWGRDDLGQLGDGDPPPGTAPPRQPSPTRVLPDNTAFLEFVTISAGLNNSCAATRDGIGMCWGFGTGSASSPFSSRPVEIGS